VAGLDDGVITGTRLAAELQEAARALGPLSGAVLDALVGVLPSLPGRRDAHLFADLTAQLAVELGRTVALPAALADLARGRSSSALARALRRVPPPDAGAAHPPCWPVAKTSDLIVTGTVPEGKRTFPRSM
jgi:hypothetical protein